jgi:hypothetical protein
MSAVIWKYPLQITDVQVISVPEGSIPLTAQIQDGTLCIWVKVEDPDAHKVLQTIHVYGTGNPLPEPKWRVYVGSVQEKIRGLSAVWHVYWVTP